MVEVTATSGSEGTWLVQFKKQFGKCLLVVLVYNSDMELLQTRQAKVS